MHWDPVLIQELHVTRFNVICTPMRFCQVYPADRGKQGVVIRSGIWVNTEIDTKSWKIIKVPNTNNITAIQMLGLYDKLTIFNIYNPCTDLTTKVAF